MKTFVVTPAPALEGDIGRALWTLQETRQRTLRAVEGLFDPDFAPRELNSIGTLLYHIAAIELDWLVTEVREADFPPEAGAWFPLDVRDESGRLTKVEGESVDRSLDRLRWVRAQLLDTFGSMDLAEFRRGRELPDYTVTPEWVLSHLALHEAGHAGQVLQLRALQGKPVRE